MLKYKIYVLFLFIISLCGLNFIKAEDNDFILLGKTIYLDPGHGGIDPGAIYKDIHESEINLEISNKIAYTLEQKGASVFFTRTGDYDLSVPNTNNRKRSDLSKRVNMINNSNCDMYISIHLNADPSTTWSGAQVFYDDINSENEKIADIIQKSLKKFLKTNRKYKKTDELYLNRKIKIPGVLVEAGFLTNPNERYHLKQDTYQQKIANSITEGIIEYFNS